MLNLHVSHLPPNHIPLDVPQGKDMFLGKLIRDNTDGIGDSHVVQNIATRVVLVLESPTIAKNITEVLVLSNDFLRDSRTYFHSFAVADYTGELCHGVSGSR